MLENPPIRRVPRNKLFEVFKSAELVEVFEAILYATGVALPENISVAVEEADQALGEALLVLQPTSPALDAQSDPQQLPTTPDNSSPDVVQPLPAAWIDGVGYPVGMGGSVTQATSKSTGVTLDKLCGQITLNAAALAAGATVGFTLTNSKIDANSVVHCIRKSGGTALAYQVRVDSVAAGSCVIAVRNDTAGSLSEAPVLQFTVFRSSTS